jgi:uncharacterized protein
METINLDNRNKYALVTGATSGIGFELAKLLAKDGYNLVLVARNKKLLQQVTDQLKEQYNVEVTPLAKDLFKKKAPFEIYNKTTEMGINIDVLINDAGQGERGKFIDIDLERNLDIIQLNIISLVSLTKLFLQDMVQRNSGRILQLGSEAGKAPMPLLSVYAATKAFVVSFSESLSNELKDTGVTVTVILPGATDTDFFHKAHAENTVVYKEEELQQAADVAKDGYEAMMKGDTRVISGAKTKAHVYMSNMMPDTMTAANLRKKMEESDEEEGRFQTEHVASRNEREAIYETTAEHAGDYRGDNEHTNLTEEYEESK